MPMPDTLEQLELTARRIWHNATLYPQDGGIVVVVDHADWTALGAALERVGPRRAHRSVVLRGARAGSGDDHREHRSPQDSPDSAPAQGGSR